MSVRRAVAALVLACATVAYGAGSASAVPEQTGAAPRDPDQVALERQVHERELALTAMFDAAQRHAAVEGVRADRLAALGYTGNLPDLEYILPIQDYHLSAGFGLTGPLWEAEHGGQDFGAYAGEPLVAVADGVVTEVAYAGPYGLRTILTLADGTEVWYCHQTDATVVVGQQVGIADVIGSVGSTGNSTGPHLHLEVRPAAGGPVDPMEWLRAQGLDP
jgi:murein DD-endopeptidase MepM/ murein hydrolase activator NlpD